MSFKCPDCGASLTDDSRFCKYCGAKIDDGVKRVEVKIDKRIEDVAEVKRAEYEAKESELRQKKMKKDMKHHSVKWKVLGVIALVGLIMIASHFLFGVNVGWFAGGLAILGAEFIYVFFEWLHKITG